MKLSSRFWAELSSRELHAAGDLSELIAVLPVGAIEQHGPHLPLAVDTLIIEGLVRAILSKLDAALPVVILPTQQIGKSNEHAGFAGTLSVQAQTLISHWFEIGQSLALSGIKKLVIFNAHGGQVSISDIVARELRVQHGMMVWSVMWSALPMPAALAARFGEHELRFGVHAGDVETSLMLALAPQLVRMEHARHFASASEERAARTAVLGDGKSAKLGWQMQDYNPQGAAGNAAAATAEKGQALLDAASSAFVLLLQELHALPKDTLQSRSSYPPQRSS